jgi:hypothetical protein
MPSPSDCSDKFKDRSLFDKIGVKPEWKVSAIGPIDKAFVRDLRRAVASLTLGRVARGCDAIFYGVEREADLPRMATLKPALKPNGALWTIRPKGRPEISEASVMEAGKTAGLVDVKVVRFSDTHTAEKFVIRVKDR